ncbi:hypothetical protein HanHA300_Chr14g0544151 [Helianthus annuus]|nr:hypothetical protein HanHA300_Chr14g0544151 [Helianthus annuus]KAJ0658007.1 hypothetical protein HanLR1_Chr14g0552981 [Helianthus annuus]
MICCSWPIQGEDYCYSCCGSRAAWMLIQSIISKSSGHMDSLAQAVADCAWHNLEEDMYYLDADNESDDDVEGKDVDENDVADLENRYAKIIKS